MLKQLRRWLGWDADSHPFEFGSVHLPTESRLRSPNGELNAAPAARVQSAPQSSSASSLGKPTAPVPNARLLEILDDPKLTLDRPSEDGFDPYNTGAFNRSTSWEKISRKKR